MNLLPWKIRELTDKVTNVVMNYTDVEARVREATNDEPWGPSGTLMQELANDTFMYESYSEVTGMLWKRIFHEGRNNWRRIYKGLLVVSYLIRNGSERFVTSTREHINDMRALQNFTYHDEHGKDLGVNVRNKAKELVSFIRDNERLREERKKCKRNKNKYVGMSSDDSKFGFRQRHYDEDSYTSNNDDQQYRDRDSDSYSKRAESNDSIGYTDDYETKEDNKSDGRWTPRGVGVKYSFSADSLEQHSDKEAYEEKSSAKSTGANANREKRSIQPSRKVNLGAAAKYTGDGRSAMKGARQPAPLADTSATVSQEQSDVFADFDSLAASREPSKEITTPAPSSDFADFSSFGQSRESNNLQQVPASNVDLLGDIVGQPMSSTIPGMNASFPQQTAPMMNMQSPAMFQQQSPNSFQQQPASSGGVFPQQHNFNTLDIFPAPLAASNPPLASPTGLLTPIRNTTPTMNPLAPMQQHQPTSQNEFMTNNQAAASGTNQLQSTKQNTWSDVKGLDINLDLFSKSNQKTIRPSMRQMQHGTGNVMSSTPIQMNQAGGMRPMVPPHMPMQSTMSHSHIPNAGAMPQGMAPSYMPGTTAYHGQYNMPGYSNNVTGNPTMQGGFQSQSGFNRLY